MGEGLGWAEARGGERVLTRRADLRHFAAPRRRPLRRRFPLPCEAIGKISDLTVFATGRDSERGTEAGREWVPTAGTIQRQPSGGEFSPPPTVTGADGKGVSYGTAWNDLQVIKTDNLPERRIGADGKRYPATKPKAKPPPSDARATKGT